MDWTPYMSGFFALGGVALGGMVSYGLQIYAQGKEEVRHARKLALDLAVAEWKNQYIRRRDFQPTVADLPVSVYLAGYTPFIEKFLAAAKKGSTPKNLASLIKEHDDDFAELIEKYRHPF